MRASKRLRQVLAALKPIASQPSSSSSSPPHTSSESSVTSSSSSASSSSITTSYSSFSSISPINSSSSPCSTSSSPSSSSGVSPSSSPYCAHSSCSASPPSSSTSFPSSSTSSSIPSPSSSPSSPPPSLTTSPSLVPPSSSITSPSFSSPPSSSFSTTSPASSSPYPSSSSSSGITSHSSSPSITSPSFSSFPTTSPALSLSSSTTSSSSSITVPSSPTYNSPPSPTTTPTSFSLSSDITSPPFTPSPTIFPSSSITSSFATSSPPSPNPESPSAVSIAAIPEVSLFDERVAIRVEGLAGGADVTLHLAVERRWRREAVWFVSGAHYVTDPTGRLDLAKDASLGGSYTGVEPMGLFWSMEASPAGPRNIRFVHRDVEEPLLYRLSVCLGHLTLRDLHVNQLPPPRPLATKTLQRCVKDVKVRRFPVTEGGVRGTLFLPPGPGPFPGLIDMFGFAGGLMENRAALMASRGFAVLSLAIFNYQDLPPSVMGVNFDYFEEATRWLTRHPSVKDGGIGIVAVSGGAVFALLMGWQLPQVVAVAVINSPTFVVMHDLYYGDRLLRKGVKSDPEMAFKVSEEGLKMRNAWMYTEDDIIPMWESPCRVLSLNSEDDGQVDPGLGERLRAMYPPHTRHLMHVLRYPGAGHLLEPPYTPHCRTCFNPPSGADLLWGGWKKEHAKAQDDAWDKVIEFFNTHLP